MPPTLPGARPVQPHSLSRRRPVTPGRLALNIHVTDGFRSQNAGVHRIEVGGGPGARGEADLYIDISDLTPLLMGCVAVTGLHRLGKVCTDERWGAVLDRALRVPRPQCLTGF